MKIAAAVALILVLGFTFERYAQGQVAVPPGTFQIDGLVANCGRIPTALIRLSAQNHGYAWYDGQSIIVNQTNFDTQPTFLKLFIYAHECGHSVRGSNEDWADCFAAKLGRDQGWFPPSNLGLLIIQLRASPGDWTHRPGPARLKNIVDCYRDPGPA